MDLDLDVTQTWQGEIVRLDEDEFVSNRIVLDYPDALVDKARAAFDDIALALAHRAFPFESSAGPPPHAGSTSRIVRSISSRDTWSRSGNDDCPGKKSPGRVDPKGLAFDLGVTGPKSRPGKPGRRR